MSSPTEVYVGADFGGTEAKLVAVTVQGKRVAEYVQPVTDVQEAPERNVATRVELLSQFVRKVRDNRGEVFGVGLSLPGLADRNGRSMRFLPGKLWGIEGIIWEEHLSVVPPASLNRVPIRVVNDAQAAALAEQWNGSATGRRNVVLLTLGTGVGGALILNGELYQGHRGRAGHFGHLILDPRGPLSIFNVPGTLEWYFGNATIASRTNGRWTSIASLVDGYRIDDPVARRVWLSMIDVLAQAIGSIINAIDPELIVIGGGVSKAGAALFSPLKQAVAAYEWTTPDDAVPIVPAHYQELSGAVGAARFIMNVSTR